MIDFPPATAFLRCFRLVNKESYNENSLDELQADRVKLVRKFFQSLLKKLAERISLDEKPLDDELSLKLRKKRKKKRKKGEKCEHRRKARRRKEPDTMDERYNGSAYELAELFGRAK